MNKYQPKLIKKEFMDIYNCVCKLTRDEILNSSNDYFLPFFEKLQYLLAEDVDDRTAEIMLFDSKFCRAVKHLAILKRINGLRMEITHAKSIITAHDAWKQIKQFPYYQNYLELASMEYNGANLEFKDRVIFLGSGPVPMSLICLYRQYGINGLGIEQVEDYADLSTQVIDSLGLSRHIQIIKGDHFSIPVEENLSLIMVGADARPKNEIFAHLAEKMPKGTKVSYRIYEKGLRRLIDDQPVINIPSEFEEYARVRPKPPVNNTSIFLIKNI